MRRGYSFLQCLVIVVVKPVLLLLTRRDWRGREHVPREGGMILAANHLSWTDPLAISHFLHESGRWPVFLAKSELFSIPVLGALVSRIGQVPVYRNSADPGRALQAAERSLAEGACVILYPEGTCTRDPDLWPMLGKTGVARLALVTGAPVIPLAHWGPHALLPYGQKRPRLLPRKVMHLAAGPPVDLSAYRDGALTAQALRGATDEVTAAVTGLLAGLRGEQPPGRPRDSRAALPARNGPSPADEPGGPEVTETSEGPGAAGDSAARDRHAGEHGGSRVRPAGGAGEEGREGA